MKKILGLDLGTNSIGWSVINAALSIDETKIDLNSIEMADSRIIPMDAATLGDFDKGNSKSQTAERTGYRGIHRLRERHLLRRERIHRALFLLGFLPEHYARHIDFENRPGKFLPEIECKLPWRKVSNKNFEFIFQASFEEMLADFAKNQPQITANGKKVPYDWTIYYLRKKALTQKISKEELAWIILNFNQKRGYYQLRGEDENTDNNKSVEYHALRVIAVEATGQKKEKDTWYNVHLENGWIYRHASSVPLDWTNKIKEFIVTTDLDENGLPKKDKEGNIKRSFRAPNEKDWMLAKKKTEATIEQSHKKVGTYIYETLLQAPYQKIRGKLIHTIERKYYKDELIAILTKQKEFHPELRDRELYRSCVRMLYANNDTHYNSLSDKDFTYLFVNDIIFYQRPLKSKKSLIANCPFEKYYYLDKVTKERKIQPIKCIAKSNPYYQEFRLWQFISDLRIYQREKEINGKLQMDIDITKEWLRNTNDYAALFDWLNDKKEIKQDTLLQSYFKIKKVKGQEKLPFRWNYVEDKAYPCNATRAALLSGLAKASIPPAVLTQKMEYDLWHLLYSVEDKYEITEALNTFRIKHQLAETFIVPFSKFPTFKKEYGAYSEKAVKKFLSLMRQGHHWDIGDIDSKYALPRINKIITGEYDEEIQERVREKSFQLKEISQFQGLPVWQASYLIYNRHSEAQDIQKWNTPQDMDEYIKAFKQHSLRNPIVEQVILETLRVVRDIWQKVGHIDEIHIELGREMKNPADKRKKITEQLSENENTNLRIKRLLMEFANPEYEVENVRPHSPSQQDILHIYEDYALNTKDMPADILDIIKKFKESNVKKQPTKSDIIRYKLWLEQKYRSPYTGVVIPLGKLFTQAYEIEHVIPQSRFFDDSFSNKIICEAEVNKRKDRQLGYEFIKNHHGEKIELGFGNSVQIFSVGEYEEFVKQNYAGNKAKMRKLLLDDTPQGFTQRQLNDSRYISKVIKGLLSNIVREKDEQEAISKNVITCTGGITDRLKKDWGLHDIWNDLIFPRFKRLNQLTGTDQFTVYNERFQKEIPAMPLEHQKGFNKKRIDHRHHAMDAIVIACATRNIVNFLNNESACAESKTSRFDLQHLLCEKHPTDESGNYTWKIKKPWKTFTQDTRETLSGIIVSFKQNSRIINKTCNYFQQYDKDGKKAVSRQTKGQNWAIRKPLHKDTVFGIINLRKTKQVRLSMALDTPYLIVDKKLKYQIKELLSQNYNKKQIEKYFKDNIQEWKNYDIGKINIYYFTNETGNPNDQLVATRKPLDTSFDSKKIKESITDTGIQKILLNHLKNHDGNAELAFSPDGIDEMNRTISTLNNGKFHQPILKVRVYEHLGNKFKVGENGNKKLKYVEAAKDTNLYFGIYQTEDGKRVYETIPLNTVIQLQKNGMSSVPERDNEGNRLLFSLSPDDLVYVPTIDELENGRIGEKIEVDRIYKLVSCTGNEGHFIPANIANPILQTKELGSNNKAQRAWSNEMIKEICIPIKINRLGEIIEYNHIIS